MTPLSGDCVLDADCGGDMYHGHCNKGSCVCGDLFLKPDCTTPYTETSHGIHTEFVIVQVLIGMVQGTMFIMLVLDLVARRSMRARVGDSRASPALVANPRGVAFLLNLAAVVGRLAWLVDPFAFRGIYPPGLSYSFMMRIPQVLWVFAFCQIGLVWSFVSNAFRLDRAELMKHTNRVKRMVYVFVGLVAILTVTFGLLTVFGIGGLVTMDGGNLVMAFTVLVVCGFGWQASASVKRLLATQRAAASRQQQERFRHVMRQTATTIVLATVVASLLIPAIIIVAIVELHPNDHPQWGLGFLFIVHVVSEGTVSASLYYSTRIPGVWKHLPCCRRSHSDGLLDMLTTHTDSEDDDRLTPTTSLGRSVGVGSFSTPVYMPESPG